MTAAIIPHLKVVPTPKPISTKVNTTINKTKKFKAATPGFVAVNTDGNTNTAVPVTTLDEDRSEQVSFATHLPHEKIIKYGLVLDH